MWNNIVVNIAWMILMTAMVAMVTVSKARLKMKRMFLPSFVGALSVVVVMGLVILLAVFSIQNSFDARYFIPVTGFLAGGVIESNSKSLDTYYSGLKNHNALYYYLLGNGATHAQAVDYFVKRALEKNMIPLLSRMAYILLGVTPMVLWSMILAGTDVAFAVFLQILMLVGMLASAPVSLLVTLLVARRYSFDSYGQLKDIDKNA
jgi:putative ABC transport system permease protein